jgi:cytochrome d ubiquinol oxidase subunit II
VFAGLTFVVLFAFHGASYLTLRTTGGLYERVVLAARRLAVPAAAAGAAFLVWTVVVAIDRNDKDVFPVVVPAVVGIAALGLAVAFSYAGSYGRAFAMTALGTVATVATLFTGLYPRVMVSSTDFSNSLDVAGAASAHYTLAVLTVVALITLPVLLLYQGWSYHVFRARVTGENVDLPAVASPTGGSPAG